MPGLISKHGFDMLSRISFRGPIEYRIRAAAALSRSIAEVSARRARNGPLLPGWNLNVEVTTDFMRHRLRTAQRMSPDEGRRFLDCIVIESPARSEVSSSDVVHGEVRGSWYIPKHLAPVATIFYLHGGGYSFFPREAYASLVSEIAQATRCKVFALDYPLAPESKYPAQLDNAIAAYKWLLNEGYDPKSLVVAGDSAGGNLTLALMLRLHELGIESPRLAIGLSPAAEFDVIRDSLVHNEPYDWLELRMVARFATWFCAADQAGDPLISVTRGDLRHLPQTYIQAGSREILIDGIRIFAERAQAQGADITLEVWEDMNHCFQMFGENAPQSREALARLGTVISEAFRTARP